MSDCCHKHCYIYWYRYERFHSLTVEEVRGYPELVQTELESYDTALCRYLGVTRTPLKVCQWMYLIATVLYTGTNFSKF